MKYIEEILARVPLDILEIGMLVYIRELMNNSWRTSEEQLRTILGPEWRRTVERLIEIGALRGRRYPQSIVLTIVAPGDKKRARSRFAIREKRQKGIVK